MTVIVQKDIRVKRTAAEIKNANRIATAIRIVKKDIRVKPMVAEIKNANRIAVTIVIVRQERYATCQPEHVKKMRVKRHPIAEVMHTIV